MVEAAGVEPECHNLTIRYYLDKNDNDWKLTKSDRCHQGSIASHVTIKLDLICGYVLGCNTRNA